MLRLTLITVNSLCSLLNIKYIYTPILNSSDSSVSESFFGSIFDIFKSTNIKTFPKSIESNIRSTITTLRSISTILMFF